MLKIDEVDRRIERHLEFWNESRGTEGVLIAVTAPKAKDKLPPVASTLKERWFDIDFRQKLAEYEINNTFYGGDSVPVIFVNYGPGALAALLGGDYRLDNDTIWFDGRPILKSLSDVKDLVLHIDSEFYRSLESLTIKLCENANGNYIVSIPDLGTNLDVLSSLYSCERLLHDIVKRPEEVAEALTVINGFWTQMLEHIYTLISHYSQYVTSWVPIINNKKWYPLLSEFSVMISPKLFKKVAFPALQHEAQQVDDVVYNIDGEQAIKQLPIVLEISGLRAVIWDPVPKYSSQKGMVFKDFTSPVSIDICRRIQQAGCRLILSGILPEDIETVLNQILPNGVFINTKCRNEKEAKELLSVLKKWMHI